MSEERPRQFEQITIVQIAGPTWVIDHPGLLGNEYGLGLSRDEEVGWLVRFFSGTHHVGDVYRHPRAGQPTWCQSAVPDAPPLTVTALLQIINIIANFDVVVASLQKHLLSRGGPSR